MKQRLTDFENEIMVTTGERMVRDQLGFGD